MDEKVKALLKFGMQAMWTQHFDDAEKAFRQAVELARGAGDSRGHARALSRLQYVLGTRGRSEEILEEVFAAVKSCMQEARHPVAIVTAQCCALRYIAPDGPNANELVQDILGGIELPMYETDVEMARNAAQLAVICNGMGDRQLAARLLERAVPVLESALGPRHAELALPLYNLADLRGVLNSYDRPEVEPMMRRAIAIQDATLAPNHPERAAPLLTLGYLLAKGRRYAEANAFLERAKSIALAFEGADGQTTQMAHAALGVLRDRLCADPAAEEFLLTSLRSEETAERLVLLCRNYFQRGEPKKAVPHYRRLLGVTETLDEIGRAVVEAQMGIPGAVYAMLGEDRGREAENLLLGLLHAMEAVLPPGHSDLRGHLYFTGNFFRMTARHADALRFFERCIELDRSAFGADDPGRADALARAFDALLELGRKKDADRVAAEIERLTGARPSSDPDLNQMGREMQAFWHGLNLAEDPGFAAAAANGDPGAAYVVALCFEHGLGVSPDAKRAREWLDRAASAGHAEAKRRKEALRKGGAAEADFSMIGMAAADWVQHRIP
jgi:tetratricopeptide (TPR) repeat protein